ncbi:MAG TPA: hypothetical protein VGM84_21040 [Steroidobacteraceae bacterium]|jgi:hypothetical protein
MRTANVNLSVVLMMAIGAAVTWLWLNRGRAPVTPGVPRPQSVTSMTRPQPVIDQAAARRMPESAPTQGAPAVVGRTAPAEAPVPHADSTYQSMLVAAQTNPENPRTEHDLLQEREGFLATADDPDWARRMEQALWDFYQTKGLPRGTQITSVSCRSEGCELQVMWGRALLGLPVDSPPMNNGPLEGLRTDWPGGLGLRRQLIIGQFTGDRTAVLITYSREDPPAAAP